MVASIGAVAAPEQGASYYERDGYYAKDDVEHRQASAWAGRGAAELGLDGPVDPDTFRAVLEGRVPDGSGKKLGRVGERRRVPPPSRARPDLQRPQIRLARGAGRRRCARDRRPRPRRRPRARLVREERRRDPDEGSRDRPHGAHGQPEGGDRDFQARRFPQPRSRAPYPFGDRQHGAGRGRKMALDGEREALRLEDAARHALPQRARGRAREARIRHREDPCRRKVRDRGGVAARHRRLFHAPRRDRGRHGRTRLGRDRGEPAPRPARGAVHPRRQARRRPGGAPRELGEAGRGPRVRRQGGGCRSGCAAGRSGYPPRARPGRRRGAGRRRGRPGCRGARHGPGAGEPDGDAVGSPGGEGRALGRRPPLRARGGVRAHRPARGRARLQPGRRAGRRDRARGRGAGEGRNPARRAPAGVGRAAHHRQGGGRRARDRRADGGRSGARVRPDARARRRQGAPGRPPLPTGRRRP